MDDGVISLNDNLENEQLLKAMGFNNEHEIRQALVLSKNDINEAVAYLTNEKIPKLLNNDDNDIIMSESTSNSPTTINNNRFNSNNNHNNNDNPDNSNLNDSITEINPYIFPEECLIQLQEQVFCDNWSIPYKKDEMLDRLLNSTIALLKKGIPDVYAENIKRFIDRVIPEVYKKLHDSMPVNKWNFEIQNGVYNMTNLLIELIAVRLHQPGVNEFLLNTLNLVLNQESIFHNKNHMKIWEKNKYVECFDGLKNCYTKDFNRHGWLLNFINNFGYHKGFEGLKNQLELSSDLNEFNLLLKPVATCSEFLNPFIIQSLFADSISRVFEFIKRLDDGFKDKNVGKVFDLLQTMKKLSSSFWPSELDMFQKIHLEVVLNMLKYPHFNSKMNSLKEICKLIENTKNQNCNTTIKEDDLSEWIIQQRILSLAVEGNIDQSQYCEKIKTIVEFIGEKINNEEIRALWNMQYNKSMSLVDNLYTIIGIAATKFNAEQLDYLLAQISQTWNDSSFKLHDKLVGLLRIIGREAKINKTYSKILEALWELKNRPGLSRQLLLLIYNEHLNVLSGGRLPREIAKANYLKKCSEDLKKNPGSSIAIASLKHMYEILNSYQKNNNKALKEVLSEIMMPIMKNLCTSLLKCHSNAYEKSKLSQKKFDHTILIDDIFTHEEVVQTHLNSMRFILQEGNLYLGLVRANEIWDILITSDYSCDWDKQIGFEWFIECYSDLNDESRSEIFKKKILSLKASKLTLKGYECFKLYFLRVNENESKIQIRNDLENFLVEKLDLTGLDNLWDIILCVEDENIADLATKFLLEILYEKVSVKLKRDLVQLHQRFINECYSRLENCLITLESSPIGQLLLDAFKIAYTSVSLTEMNSVPIAPRSEILKCIERLLMIAERYIISVEENNFISRNNLPHFISFKSESFLLTILCENRQPLELFVCSNETLADLKLRISTAFSISSNSIQVYLNEKLLNQSNDMKLLNNLNIDGMQPLTIKVCSTYPSSLNQTPVKDSNMNFSFSRVDPEQEKSFPGVLISNNSSAFDMLNRLEDFEEPKIRIRVRNIIKLIPTNPRLLEAFDSIIGKIIINSQNSTQTSSTASVAAAASSILSSTNRSLVKSPSTSSMIVPSIFLPPTQSQTSLSTPSTPTSHSSSLLTSNLFSSQQTTSTVLRNDSSSSLCSNSTYATITNSAMPVKDFARFFDKKLPLHRILYHLEALSSRITPSSSSDANIIQNAELFQQDFLKANGLEVLVSLLKLENFVMPTTITTDNFKTSLEYETKQDIYILLLQTLRLFLFGSIYSLNPTIPSANCKRPSTEPITTCVKKTIMPSMILNQVDDQNINSQDANYYLNNLESKNLTIIQKMQINEIIDLITQLMTIFWSAAAGNIQLGYSFPISTSSSLTSISAGFNNNINNHSNMPDNSLNVKSNQRTTSNSSGTNLQVIPVSESFIVLPPSQYIDSQTSTQNTSCKSSLKILPQNNLIDNDEITDTIDVNLNRSQKEVKFFIPDHRLSTGSNMSTSSVDSSDNQSQNSFLQFSPSSAQGLQNGICIKQTSITVKDVKIATKAIEIISCFLQYRKDCISSLFNMKMFNDCIIDVLTGSISPEIRICAENFLLKLSQIETLNFKCKDHLINLIIKARLPLWVNSSVTRSSNQRLISQSTQYFNLRCALFKNLTIEEQSNYSIDLNKMLNHQVSWFSSFTPTKSLKELDNVLLTGHLCLTKSLLTCETANKADVGDEIIPQIIKTYLFPASYLINFPTEDSSMDPICSNESSRLAAYKLLVELSRNCLKNFRQIVNQLILLHHSSNRVMVNEWNIIPLVTPRAECGFVGIKNGGATCYMNAVLQQLYMIPGITDYLLSIEDDIEKNTVFWQLQNVFAHLKESKLEYYIPEQFWKAFRMWGQEVNLREQQDAFDFFISMTDQIDEHLKKIDKEPIFKNIFEGTFSNQFICKDCPHKYEREEVFLGLNLPIKSGNLQESLLQFVKDELLDGDNCYYCEKCNEKRSAIKRTCIKKLPKYLCIQLKRFDYDWESNRSLKFDDYFQFPRNLNVSPYIYESINKVRDNPDESSIKLLNPINEDDLNKNANMDTDTTKSQLTRSNKNAFKRKNQSSLDDNEINYELVGVVVHSGQANAGHYYSFIKGSKSNTFTTEQEIYELEQLNQSIEETLMENVKCQQENENDKNKNKVSKAGNLDASDKWYKFNDTSVEEINFNDTTMMEECFGGTFIAASDFKLLPEERVRYWNAYMLFYREPDYNNQLKRNTIQNMDKLRQRRDLISRDGDVLTGNSFKSKVSRDSLSELAELVTRGDEKGLFRTSLPPAIEQTVKTENLEFCKNRGIYDRDYFQFIYNLVKTFKENEFNGENKQSQSDLFTIESSNMGLEFFFNTYFKTGKKLRTDLGKWLECFKELFYFSKESSNTMLNFVVSHEVNSSFIRHYLLECPIVEIREACGQLFEYFLSSLIAKFDQNPLNNSKITSLITSLTQLLDKAVIDLCKNSHEYFKLLYVYANMSKETAQQLISLGLFSKLLCFLLGNPGTIKADESNRRWSSVQLREFSIVHELIASLILKCNILSLKTCDLPEEPKSPTDIPLIDYLQNEMTGIQMGPQSELETQAQERCSLNDSNLENKSDEYKFFPPLFGSDLLPVPQEIKIYLLGALSNRYLKELVFTFEQINQNSLAKTLEMILSCCYCNEAFSTNIIQQILLHVHTSSSNEIKQALSLLYKIVCIEDPLQLTRFKLAIDGHKESYYGLLAIIRQNQSSDAKKSYHCVKFIVTLANQSGSCRDYLLKTANNWEWSVNWLKNKMSESSSINSNYINWNSTKFQSNEDTEIKTFQRTKSAQRTLDDATALLRSSEFDY